MNELWKWDAVPNLHSLDAHTTVTIADLKGPAQINTIHFGQVYTQPLQKGVVYDTARAIVLRIFFDGAEDPAVSVPFGDFFADGTGRAVEFSTQFVEKTLGSYNCYVPMPFKKAALVQVTNDSDRDLSEYSVVEWQTLPRWEEDLGYFHANWQRHSFQLTPETAQTFYHLPGPGHLIGEYWLLRTDEPLYAGMALVVEGDNEYRIDGQPEPSIDYMGSEDSFNFSWGWQRVFVGYKVGINLREDKPEGPVVSVYRFRDRDVIRFRESLDFSLNWKGTFKGIPIPEVRSFLDTVRKRNAEGGGWVEYAETTYWYSTHPEGSGVPLPPLAERLKPLMHPNPKPPQKPPEKPQETHGPN